MHTKTPQLIRCKRVFFHTQWCIPWPAVCSGSAGGPQTCSWKGPPTLLPLPAGRSSLCFSSSTATHCSLASQFICLGTGWQGFWYFKKIQNLPVLDFLIHFPVLLSEGTEKRSNLHLRPPLPSLKYCLSGLHSLNHFSQVMLSPPLS